MTFANNSVWIFLIVFCIIFYFCRKYFIKKRQLAANLFATNLEGLKLHKFYHKKLILTGKISLFIGIIFLFIALARPQYGETMEKRYQLGLNVLFALDTSKSMLADDVRPNRLELAKLSIEELIKSIGGNHVGLIAFAGNAFLQCPSTNDYSAFKLSLKALDTNVIPKGGTNLASAMDLAEKTFDENATYRQLILLTDGEDLSGTAIQSAKRMASKGIVIHTVGIGSGKGSPIRIKDNNGSVTYAKDNSGNTVMTKLDSTTLQQIAQITNGFYTQLGNAGEGLKMIYDTAIKHLPKENFESVEYKPIERYMPYATIALLLILFDTILTQFLSIKKAKYYKN